MINIKFTIFLFITLFSISTSGQDREVEVSLQRDSIMIGEQVSYTLKISDESEANVILPADEYLFPEGIELIDKSTDSSTVNQINKLRFDYLITGFDSGLFVISEIPVTFSDASSADTLFTQSLNLNIFMPEVDTTAAIKDIKAPINTPLTFKEVFPWIALAFGILLIIAAVIYFYQILTGRKELPLRKEPEIPPHVKAIQRLNKLKEEKIWQKGRVKEYYVILSDTIRIYLEERYEINAMELITSEILEKFRKHAGDDNLLMEMLENLLGLSDMVKFAKEDPTPMENETNLNNAYIFVEKTKPTEVLTENTHNKSTKIE